MATSQSHAPLHTQPGNLIRRAMEGLWLATVFLVPLAMAPDGTMLAPFETTKLTVLRVGVALMAMLWILETVVERRPFPLPRPDAWWPQFIGWVRAEPTRLVLVAASLFLAANVISSLWSLSFRISLWGKTPGEDGYALYTIASYFLLFLVIATHVRRPAQVWRLLGAIAATGALVGAYGILQTLGQDPFNWMQANPNDTRVISTVGNAVHVGGLLVLTIFVTLVLTIVTLQRGRWLGWFPVWATVIGIQIATLALTLGRGAWIGVGVGVIAFFGAALIAFWGRMFAFRSSVLLGGTAAVIVLILLAGTGRFGTDGWGPIRSAVTRGTTLLNAPALESVIQRVHVWKGSLDLIVERPTPGYVSDQLASARHLVGYGPDMFQNVFPLRSPPELEGRVTQFFDYAHNHLLHELVELGALGLLSYLALLAAVVGIGMLALTRHRHNLSPAHRWILVGLLALTVARVVEELSGIARVSDLTVFWALLGLFVALPWAMGTNPDTKVAKLTKRATSRRGVPHQPRTRPPSWAGLLLVGIAIVALGTLSWTKNVNYLWASVVAISAAEAAREGDGDRGLALIDQAISRAPDVVDYHLLRGELFTNSIPQTDSPTAKRALAEEAYASNLRGFEASPFSAHATAALADSTLALVLLGRNDKFAEAVFYYDRLPELLPNDWEVYDIRAHAFLKLLEPELALTEVEKSLAITKDSSRSTQAYLLKAFALFGIGSLIEAQTSVARAIQTGDLPPQNHQAALQLEIEILEAQAAESGED
jgi:O-antigen ligase